MMDCKHEELYTDGEVFCESCSDMVDGEFVIRPKAYDQLREDVIEKADFSYMGPALNIKGEPLEEFVLVEKQVVFDLREALDAVKGGSDG